MLTIGSRTRAAALLLSAIAIGACASSDGDGDSSSSDLVGAGDDGAAAFRAVSRSLQTEVTEIDSTSTQALIIDAHTTGAMVASIVPAKNTTTVGERGATPRSLEGVYWMRGNPLADYLLSFANIHWTTGNGTPFGYLSISAPGSFAFKRKAVAKGAVDGDFKFLPEVCRVPRDDRTLQRIANAPGTYDPKTFTRSIAEDFAAMAADPGAPDGRSEQFISDLESAGQLPLDGPGLLQTAHDGHAVYESRWNGSFTESSVQVVYVATAPGILRTLLPPIRLPVPEWLGAFSLAPHLDGDRDVFVRKTFLAGTKAPNYYYLTRIVDADGRELPHFKEFVQCVQERSGGEILKVVPP
jgi:hypothetical protein